MESVETKEIIAQFRKKMGLSQNELAEKLFVTRQAVSRWEHGDTIPDTNTLKQLSMLFGVSVNTLLGSPLHLVCQCCGMPLEDDSISREPDGRFIYGTMEELLDFLTEHMSNESFPPEQAREHFAKELPKLKHWAKS